MFTGLVFAQKHVVLPWVPFSLYLSAIWNASYKVQMEDRKMNVDYSQILSVFLVKQLCLAEVKLSPEPVTCGQHLPEYISLTEQPRSSSVLSCCFRGTAVPARESRAGLFLTKSAPVLKRWLSSFLVYNARKQIVKYCYWFWPCLLIFSEPVKLIQRWWFPIYYLQLWEWRTFSLILEKFWWSKPALVSVLIFFLLSTIRSLLVRNSSPDVILNHEPLQAHMDGKVSFLGAFEIQSTEQFPEGFLFCEMAYGRCLKQAWMVSMSAWTPMPRVGCCAETPMPMCWDNYNDGGGMMVMMMMMM